MQTVLPERGITIDEALILLAQLSGRKERLNGLASRQPKSGWETRYFGGGSGPSSTATRTTTLPGRRRTTAPSPDEIAALQLELDLVNQTEVFSVEL